MFLQIDLILFSAFTLFKIDISPRKKCVCIKEQNNLIQLVIVAMGLFYGN